VGDDNFGAGFRELSSDSRSDALRSAGNNDPLTVKVQATHIGAVR